MPYEFIPTELRALNQWVIWRVEQTATGKPTKVPYSPNTGRFASVTNPADWSSFFTAQAALAASGYSGIGFVFTPQDDLAGIDLDASQDVGVVANQTQVFNRFYGRTYAELSQSGQGLHFICKGRVPRGKRRGQIEVYSSERFFAMTGNVYGEYVAPSPMQAELDWLYAQLGGNETSISPVLPAGSQEDATNDREVWERAARAQNGDKFMALWNGDWEGLGYPSQSEADFALIDIIGFYTQSIPQIKRLFRMSGLGQRDKAQSEKPRVHGQPYVDWQAQRALDRQPPPLDIDAIRQKIEQQFQRDAAPRETMVRREERPIENPYLRPVPGLLGQIAYFIYQASPRPVAEIALAGAIGLLAGITGRAWNVSGTGLNHYTMLLGDTGTGKEAIHTGIRRIMSQVASIAPGGGGCPAAVEFMGPDDIASGQALVKYLTKVSRSFVTVQGEFDLTLKTFVSKHANAAMVKLKQVILKAYSRSGRGQVLEGTIYSDTEKNTAPIIQPAFSIIGEGTPERFYNLLDETLVADGLLPRFTIIHYDGGRVPLNKAHRDVEPPDGLVRIMASLCGQSLMLNQANQVIDVRLSPEAEAMLDSYGHVIDQTMNDVRADVIKQIWNRAHLKALKLAAIVAVGINSTQPVIDVEAAQYAIDIVNYDTTRLVAKFESGDVGESEGKQVADLRRIMRRYLQSDSSKHKNLGATPLMMYDRVIPKRYLQQRVHQMASFKHDRLGAMSGLDRVLKALIEAGVIQELGPMDAAKYAVRGAKLYAVLDPEWLGQVVGVD